MLSDRLISSSPVNDRSIVENAFIMTSSLVAVLQWKLSYFQLRWTFMNDANFHLLSRIISKVIYTYDSISSSISDMRKQSINIYLTFLAVFDNGVLIFSILMLNLPAITEYQHMSTLVHTNTSHAHLTTPHNFYTHVKSFPSSTSTYFTSTTSIFYPQEQRVALMSTRTPPDTGQTGKAVSSRASARVAFTASSSTSSTSPEWSTDSPNGILTVTPSTVLTSLPFRSSSVSSFDGHPVTSFASTSPVATTLTHPIRHLSTPSALNSVSHRSKRTKRRLLRPVHQPSTSSTSMNDSDDPFTSQINAILQSCFNLTSDDLNKLKQNMVLLNTSSSLAPQPVEQSATPHDLVNRLFFEALLRQLILWVQLNSKRSHLLPFSPVSSITKKAYSPKHSAVTDLLKCRRSLLKYYRPEVHPTDQQSTNHSSNDSALLSKEGTSPKDGFQPLDYDEVTSINLLLLSTLEEIYQTQFPSPTDPTKAFQGENFYADSLTGDDYSVFLNESTRKSNVSTYEKNAEGEYLSPPPPAGNLYPPLLYYVKIVYPLALISQSGSIWTTCLITIERYLAVCHPLMSLTLSTRSRAIWALCILSTAAFLFNIPRFAEVDTTSGTIFPSELRRNHTYYIYYYICLNLSLNYILPLSLLFALNIKIYASVRHANAHRNELTRARQSELHLASMLVLIVAIFIGKCRHFHGYSHSHFHFFSWQPVTHQHFWWTAWSPTLRWGHHCSRQ